MIPTYYIAFAIFSIFAVAQLMGACSSVAVVLLLAFCDRARWRFLAYSYELGLVALTLHFLARGPQPLSGSITESMYLAAQAALALPAIAPIAIEWRAVARVGRRFPHVRTLRGRVVVLFGVSVVLFVIISWLVHVFVNSFQWFWS